MSARFPAHRQHCEGLRMAANLKPSQIDALADSQVFAGLRKAPDQESARMDAHNSQDSQFSQG